MTKYLIILGVIFIIVPIVLNFSEKKRKNIYRYKRKEFFMSRAEHELFDVLTTTVGDKYYIFAQVHLPTLLEHKIKGQKWLAAFRHINQKSVDFVLCDKNYIAPKLVIELDDNTHEREDRKERDKEVEQILKEANLSLLRLQNHQNFNPQELAKKIFECENNTLK